MPRAKQITVWVTDQPGVLAAVASALGEKKVNIQAVLAHTHLDQGAIHLVVDKPAAAKKVLAAKGWKTSEEDVVAVTLPDKPGTLAAVASRLGNAGINIQYAFVGAAKGARKVNCYMAVGDVAAALKALR